MEYRLSNTLDVSVMKVGNGFLARFSSPDVVGATEMFFADELEAYEFAALQISNVIQGLKDNG